MRFDRRTAIAGALLPMALLCAPFPAAAQSFPDRPIKLIVPFGAGSAVDTIARAIAAQVAEQTGQGVLVDNRTGANGIIAAEAAAKSPADGYTLFMPNDGIMAANPALYAKLPYDPIKDFAPVTLTSTVPLVLVGNPAFAAKTVPELIALAKAKPGSINYSSTGSGSAQHLAMEFFKMQTGINMLHVPYKGSALAVPDLISGQIDTMFGSAPALLPHVRSGRLKPLAVSSAEPSALFPDLPTVAAGGLPGYEAVSLLGLFAPAKTPAAIINRLNQDIVRAMAGTDIKQKFFNAGSVVVGSSPDELATLVKSEMNRIGKVIVDAKIRVQ